jgi:hypothetical protein
MMKRLVVGLVKGLVLGGAIGAAIQFGLLVRFTGHPHLTSGGLLGALVAMGAAGTAGVFAGRPPWREGAWIEALIKGVFGMITGGGIYWLAAKYGAQPIPFPRLPEPIPATSLPVVFSPLIAALYGAIVELDNTGDDTRKPKPKRKPIARVANAEIEDAAFDEGEAVTRQAPPPRRKS